MRSSTAPTIVTCALGWLLLQCDSREDRVMDVCGTLLNCGAYQAANPSDALRLKDECEGQVTDALEDDRVSRTDLTRCAHCLGSHASLPGEQTCLDPSKCENCRSVMAERDCDSACKGISYALRARTSAQMREEMCQLVDQSCGGPNPISCAHSLSSLYYDLSAVPSTGTARSPVPLSLDEALALDATVEGCWACTQQVRKALNTEEATTRAGRCATLVSACSEACSLVRAVAQVLAPAATALALCDLAERCVDAPPGEGEVTIAAEPLSKVLICPGGLESGLTEDEGTAGDEGARRRVECFERRVVCREASFQSNAAACLTCAGPLDCSQVASECRTACEGEPQ